VAVRPISSFPKTRPPVINLGITFAFIRTRYVWRRHDGLGWIFKNIPRTSITSVGDRDPAHCFSDYLNCCINFAATPELTGRAFLAGTHPIITRLIHVPILPVYQCA
jgi:hypothetical protein